MKYAVLLLAAMLSSCGYRAGTQSDLIPATASTIAVPAFGNGTVRYKLTDRMPAAIAKEFITRTKYRVVTDPDRADIVLNGAILNYNFYPIIFDDVRQRANVAELRVTLQLSLTDRATGKVLYQRSGFDINERYQISPDPSEYFEESDFALRRASEQVARQVVTQILQAF